MARDPQADEDEGDESEESEEETEEAQMCWSFVFTFLPVIFEVAAEFAGAAMDAVSARLRAAQPPFAPGGAPPCAAINL